jgi:hypothetical protein
MSLDEGGDGTQGANADDRLRVDLDVGGVRDEHPRGDDQRHTARIANGHRLVPIARADDLEFVTAKRVKGVPDSDGGT